MGGRAAAAASLALLLVHLLSGGGHPVGASASVGSVGRLSGAGAAYDGRVASGKLSRVLTPLEQQQQRRFNTGYTQQQPAGAGVRRPRGVAVEQRADRDSGVGGVSGGGGGGGGGGAGGSHGAGFWSRSTEPETQHRGRDRLVSAYAANAASNLADVDHGGTSTRGHARGARRSPPSSLTNSGDNSGGKAAQLLLDTSSTGILDSFLVSDGDLRRGEQCLPDPWRRRGRPARAARHDAAQRGDEQG